MQSEDARWQAAYDQHRAEFHQLRERALREIAAVGDRSGPCPGGDETAYEGDHFTEATDG